MTAILQGTMNNSAVLITAILVFLAVVKVPPALDSDIQPWDEAMYAARVNSIHVNGDFFDQAKHSVGGFYSGSHPPLLIWLGYAVSAVFGFHPATLKLFMILVALTTVMVIWRIGRLAFDEKTALLASVVFSSGILFNVFSKRFQLDMLYLLFMTASFLFVLCMMKDKGIKYAFAGGLMFGLCLMSKILVGMFIPFVAALLYLFGKKRGGVSLRQIFVLTATGLSIALPWHLYMYFAHGSSFTDYFFGFHLIERITAGVEMNQKGSGYFYYLNYFLSIMPYGALMLFAFIRDARRFKDIEGAKLLLWIWAIAGFAVISVSETKLESYLLLVLPAVSLIIADYLGKINDESQLTRLAITALLFLNFFWFATEALRPELKSAFGRQPILANLLYAAGILVAAILTGVIMSKMKDLSRILKISVVTFFVVINLYYLFNIPLWENRFRLSEGAKKVRAGGAEKIVYVGTNFRYNPQFSYYFNGIDLGWSRPEFAYEFMDTNAGNEKVKARLEAEKSSTIAILERDKINRADYPEASEVIPEKYRMIHKDTGYEIYANKND